MINSTLFLNLVLLVEFFRPSDARNRALNLMDHSQNGIKAAMKYKPGGGQQPPIGQMMMSSLSNFTQNHKNNDINQGPTMMGEGGGRMKMKKAKKDSLSSSSMDNKTSITLPEQGRMKKMKPSTTSATSTSSIVDTKKHQSATTVGNLHDQKVGQLLPPEQQHSELDCGSFIIRQTNTAVVYDDFQEVDPAVEGMEDILMCHEAGNSELCMGGEEESAVWVHGTCTRGRGQTKIKFVAMKDDSQVLFACGGSPEATPSVECTECKSLINKGKACTVPFRAEMRFGILDIRANSAGKCFLYCKMPTTDE